MKHLCLLITFALVYGACKEKKEESESQETPAVAETSTPSNTSASQSKLALLDLVGVWGGCDSGKIYREVSIDKNGSYTARFIEYGSGYCEPGSEKKEFRTMGKISVKDDAPDLRVSSHPSLLADVTIDDYSAIFYSQEAALEAEGVKMNNSGLNPTALCEDMNFPLGKPISFIGKRCLSKNLTQYDEIKSQKYEDLYVVDGKNFYYSDSLFAVMPTDLDQKPARNFIDALARVVKQDEVRSIAYNVNPTLSLDDIHTKLQGLWKQCTPEDGEIITLEFDGNNTTQVAEFYRSEVSCSGSNDPDDLLYRISLPGTYALNGLSDFGVGAFEIDWLGSDSIFEMTDPIMVDYFNGTGAFAGVVSPFCTDVTFVLDQPSSLIGKNCDTSGNGYATVTSSTLYDILFLNLKTGSLFDSQPQSAEAGQTPESRVNQIDWDAEYVKQ